MQTALRREEVDSGSTSVTHTETKSVPHHYQLASPKEQLKRLMNAYPSQNLDPVPFERFLDSRAWDSAQLPDGAEGFAVIPAERKFAHQYDVATRMVTRCMGQTYAQSELSDPLRRRTHSSQWMALMRQQQQFDFMLLPVQCGIRFRGYSGEQVHNALKGAREFALGAWEVANILLAHKSRLDSCQDLGIDAAGDSYHPDIMPSFSVEKRQLKFHTRSIGTPDFGFAAATGFYFTAH